MDALQDILSIFLNTNIEHNKMTEFEIGKTYEFETIEIRQDDKTGVDYIALRDDSCDTYRVYNILKFQYDNLPETITAVVKSLDFFERPRLKQETSSIYQKIYEFGKSYDFKITDIKQDICSPTKAEYYEIEDDWCVHRYYFKEQLYDIGETCTLLVEGLTKNGDLNIKEIETPKATGTAAPTPVKEDSTKVIDFSHYPVLDFGEESTTLEYKTSIVFKDGEPKIDEQLFVIVKTLVAFMNSQGGDLYIGIHDKTRAVIGISDDMKHLNEGDDEFNGQYEPTTDKYQLKIRHALERLSQGVAEELVEFEFPECQGVQYCHIKVKSAKRPVWVRDNILFQRTGNRITKLKKDEITNFVYDRVRLSVKEIIDMEGLDEATMTPEKIAEVVKLVNNAHRKAIAAPKQNNNSAEAEYYIVWYDNGTWKRLRDASAEENVFKVLPVNKSEKEGVLVFCYESGNVNEVRLSEFKSKVNLNKLVTNRPGFNPNEKPKEIFLANTNHFIAVYGADEHGTEYVKVHRVTDFNPTQSSRNQGSRILPAGDKLLSYKLISGEHESKLAPLIFQRSKTRDAGVPIGSVSHHVEIEYLNSL